MGNDQGLGSSLPGGHCLAFWSPGDFPPGSPPWLFSSSTRKPQALFPETCVPVPMSATSRIQLPCAHGVGTDPTFLALWPHAL